MSGFGGASKLPEGDGGLSSEATARGVAAKARRNERVAGEASEGVSGEGIQYGKRGRDQSV